MSKKFAIPFIIGAFILGLVGGAGAVAYLWGKLDDHLITSTAASETSVNVAVLKALRTNKITNAENALEAELDGSIMQLGFSMDNIPKAKRDPQQLKSLEIAKEYREKFPRNNSDYPEIEQSVSNAFLLVSDEK